MKITIKNLNNLTVQNNDNEKTVLSVLQENCVDWMHACGAKGRCTTCKMIVDEGIENLSLITEAEERFLSMGKLDIKKERLTCQTRLLKGEIKVVVPNHSKLPHMKYSN